MSITGIRSRAVGASDGKCCVIFSFSVSAGTEALKKPPITQFEAEQKKQKLGSLVSREERKAVQVMSEDFSFHHNAALLPPSGRFPSY